MAQRNHSVPQPHAPPWLARHRESSHWEGSERGVSKVEALPSQVVFLLYSPKLFIHTIKSGNLAFLWVIGLHLHVSLWCEFCKCVYTEQWDPVTARFPPLYFCINPFQFRFGREGENFPQFSHQVMYRSHLWWNHWSMNQLRNDGCWKSAILLGRLITKLLITKQATKNLPSPP